MFSSDDDEPLAVIASKTKRQEKRVVRKERRQKTAKRKRFQSESSEESDANDVDEKEKRTPRKKKKPALEDEFDSDEIPLADVNDESGEVHKSCEDTSINGRDSQSNEEHSSGEKETSMDDASQRPSSRCDDSKDTRTHKEQNSELSSEKHAKVEEESDSSSSDDSEKKIASEEDGEDLENSNKEHAQVDGESDNSTSDSDENKELEKEIKAKKEKKKRKTKQKTEDESAGKKEVRNKKEQRQDGAAVRLSKLKKMVTLAGLRIVYKKFFEDVADNDRLRVKALEKEMERRGLTPPFTMEACKAFKLQKEQEAEVSRIIKELHNRYWRKSKRSRDARSKIGSVGNSASRWYNIRRKFG
ncbi:hypothetical protein KIN20_038281 [Parelaphostrongylus tenuis]|uniref:Uncharacterized protein n=1 Tax=Parelaphostrongylus tenuis TaxID=148309 RepID=A0AAD5REM8_PARTN|nr:hypothetical protein KIN20_038281 [Parelaphostrongylus tenuis]